MSNQTLTIKGQPYKLILKDDVFLYDGTACVGLTNKSNHEIIISMNSNWEDTLLHELMHAYFHECGLEEYCNDEILVDWLSKTIPQISKVYNIAFDRIEREIKKNRNGKCKKK